MHQQCAEAQAHCGSCDRRLERPCRETPWRAPTDRRLLPAAGSLVELALAGASGEGAGDALASLLRAAAASACPLRLLDVRGCPLTGGALDALCALLRSPHVPLATLRADVATKEGAERIAQVLPGNSTLVSLMLGGPVPEHVLSFVSAVLSSNANGAASPGSRGSPQQSAPTGATPMGQPALQAPPAPPSPPRRGPSQPRSSGRRELSPSASGRVVDAVLEEHLRKVTAPLHWPAGLQAPAFDARSAAQRPRPTQNASMAYLTRPGGV
jgi:hypothetical protein